MQNNQNKLPSIEICQKHIDMMPGEHTKLRTLDDLTKEDGFYVCDYNCNTSGFLVSTKRDENNQLKSYFSKSQLCHEVIIGSSGSGKSQGFTINVIMSLDGTVSYIINDPKGELYAATHKHLEKKYGKENVRCIDYLTPEKSDTHINYLCELGHEWLKAIVDEVRGTITKQKKNDIWELIVSNIIKYVNTIFIITDTKEPSWQRTAINFIAAIIIALFEDLGTIGLTKYGKNEPETINFNVINKIFHEFSWNIERESSLNDKGFFTSRNRTSTARQMASPLINNAAGTRANYLQFVENYLKEVNDRTIKIISEKNDFDILTLGKKPQIIFQKYDISHTEIKEYVNKVTSQFINALFEYSHKTVKPLDVPVVVLCDEFPTLNPNPIYPRLLATGRGSNIFLHMIIQSYSQLSARYPDDYITMIENCNYTYFIGTNDQLTAEKFSKELGLTTIADPVLYLQGKLAEKVIPVVSQDYLMHRMKEGEVFIKVNKEQPIHGFFEFYYKTKEYHDEDDGGKNGKKKDSEVTDYMQENAESKAEIKVNKESDLYCQKGSIITEKSDEKEKINSKKSKSKEKVEQKDSQDLVAKKKQAIDYINSKNFDSLIGNDNNFSDEADYDEDLYSDYLNKEDYGFEGDDDNSGIFDNIPGYPDFKIFSKILGLDSDNVFDDDFIDDDFLIVDDDFEDDCNVFKMPDGDKDMDIICYDDLIFKNGNIDPNDDYDFENEYDYDKVVEEVTEDDLNIPSSENYESDSLINKESNDKRKNNLRNKSKGMIYSVYAIYSEYKESNEMPDFAHNAWEIVTKIAKKHNVSKKEIVKKLSNAPIVVIDNLTESEAKKLAYYLGQLKVVSFIIKNENDEIVLQNYEKPFSIYRPLLLINNGKGKLELVDLIKNIIRQVKGKVLDEVISSLNDILVDIIKMDKSSLDSMFKLFQIE